LEGARGIKVRAAGVVEEPVVVGFDADDAILLPHCECLGEAEPIYG
jgi:hypothetical protein